MIREGRRTSTAKLRMLSFDTPERDFSWVISSKKVRFSQLFLLHLREKPILSRTKTREKRKKIPLFFNPAFLLPLP